MFLDDIVGPMSMKEAQETYKKVTKPVPQPRKLNPGWALDPTTKAELKRRKDLRQRKGVDESLNICKVCGQTPCNCTHVIKENAWNDGTNSWTSEHDQWTKESVETIVPLTGVDEDGMIGPDSTSPIHGGMNEQRLSVGDPVVVTAPNAYKGKTGEISEFSPSGKFVIVNLYNHGEHSMHLSDVEYNQYADDEDADEYGSYEDDMAEGIFDRFKTPKQDPKAEALRKELMLKDRETVPDMDDYSWQIGWHYGDGNKDVKAAYSDAYYDNPTIPSPPEPRSFKLGFDARKKQGVAEASTIDGQVQDPKSLVWKQTNMPYEAAVKQFGSKNVRVKRGGLRNGQDFIEVLCPLGEQAVAEAKATGQRVKVIKGDYSGKTGTIDEVLTNPFRHYGKMYKINLDDGTSVTLSNDALRLVKTVAEAGLGMWGGGEPDAWDSMSAEEQKASLKQSSERQAAKNKEETEKGRVDFINLNKDEPGFEGGLYGPYDQGIFDFVSGRDFAGGSDEYERGWRVARKYSKQQDLDEVKQRLDAKCWKGKHKEGTKIKGGVRVNNCVPNESLAESTNYWTKLQNEKNTRLNTLVNELSEAIKK